jgi:hypothetical protein
MSWRNLRAFLLIAGCCCLLTATGCVWLDKLRGPGFSHWDEDQGAGLRPKTANSKPSGFFTDTRSDQIEKHLGYDQ